MSNTCMIVLSKKLNDERFRPGTATPDMHWAYRLLDTHSVYEEKKHKITYPKGVSIHWANRDDDVIRIKISSELWRRDEACFIHIMDFVRQNGLTYAFSCNMKECTRCVGHPKCVANDHTDAGTFASDLSPDPGAQM